MGLFYRQFEHQYSQRGTAFWENEGKVRKQCSIKGIFQERDHNGVVNSIEFSANEQKIYFYSNQALMSLQLNLTVLQEHFYYNEQQKVYEIKLKRGNLITVIYTNNSNTFIKFYKYLAKFTILVSFEKQYKLLNLIGRGCTSNVYLGQNILTKQEVALKVFEKKSTDKSEDRKLMIKNEIINLEKLRQFNLSPLIGVYETNDCVIIVMKRADAGNLLQYLQQHSHHYNEELVKNIIFKVLQNLKQLHSAGFIHKDIKPDNILFHSFNLNSGLFLADFGSAVMKKDAGISPISRISAGTLGFIAPQIITNSSYDEKCDIFSVGSLLYFLLKGEPLFGQKSCHQIYELLSDDMIIERKISAIQIGQDCKSLLQKLLKIDPRSRLSASEALADEFFENIKGQTISVNEQNFALEQYVCLRAKKFFQ